MRSRVLNHARPGIGLALLLLLAGCNSFLGSRLGCGPDGCEGEDPKWVPPGILHQPSVHHLACDLDHLEKQIDWNGSVVAKAPDVWGQARLTLYREQFETEMVKEIGKFTETLQGSISRQDQAFLLSSTAIQAALSSTAATTTTPATGAIGPNGQPSTPASVAAVNLSNTTPALPGLIQTQVTDQNGKVTGTTTTSLTGNDAAFGPTNLKFSSQFSPTLQKGEGSDSKLLVGLEPTEVLAQKRRYLDFLNQLRRNNEGDDTADSPGYALHLMRIPVSVLPGKHTDKGHGAEITMTLTPVLGDDLLPITFRRLVINDVVNQLAFPITQILSDGGDGFKELLVPEVKWVVETMTVVNDYLDANDEKSAKEYVKWLKSQDRYEAVMNHLQEAGDKELLASLLGEREAVSKHLGGAWERFGNLLKPPTPLRKPTRFSAVANLAIPTVGNPLKNGPGIKDGPGIKGRAAPQASLRRLGAGISIPQLSFSPGTENRTAFPTTQIADIYGTSYAFEIAFGIRQALEKSVRVRKYAHLPNVQAYLKEELNAAYDLLSNPHNQGLWDFCSPDLVRLIRSQNFDQLDKQRHSFRMLIAQLAMSNPTSVNNAGPVQLSKTSALAWAIVVDAALLTDKLCRDMKQIASVKGTGIPGAADWMPLYLPAAPPDACNAFREYVRVRWPIKVFALDPDVQEQNLADRLSTRRELQLALSLAFTSGRMNFSQLTRYARRIEAEYETIELNRTQIGFSHGENTFGWRFYPRFQSPDIPGNLTVVTRDLLIGGPNKNQLLRQRRLEPGPRECVALVIMPSFVPYVTIDTASNFFGLTNPKHKVFHHAHAVKLGHTVKAITTKGCGVPDADQYRNGDVERLVRRAEQLEARLPLQTMTVQTPTEGNLGGFEMFSHGTTDLAPELFGWYGAPGVDARKATTLFLVGNRFSPLRTHVIIGNKEIPAEKKKMLSRQVMQVEVAPDHIRLDAPNQNRVSAHIATPYGVTRELLIPVVTTDAIAPAGYYLASESSVWKLTLLGDFKDAKKPVFPAPGGSISAIHVRAVFPSGVAPKAVGLTLDFGGSFGTIPVNDPKANPIAVDANGNIAFSASDLKAAVASLASKVMATKAPGTMGTPQTIQEVKSVMPVSARLIITPDAGTNQAVPQTVNGILQIEVTIVQQP